MRQLIISAIFLFSMSPRDPILVISQVDGPCFICYRNEIEEECEKPYTQYYAFYVEKECAYARSEMRRILGRD